MCASIRKRTALHTSRCNQSLWGVQRFEQVVLSVSLGVLPSRFTGVCCKARGLKKWANARRFHPHALPLPARILGKLPASRLQAPVRKVQFICFLANEKRRN